MGTVGVLLALGSTCLAVQEDRPILSPERHGTKAAPVEDATVWSIDLRLSKLSGDFDGGEDAAEWEELFQDGIGVGFDLAWWMPVHPWIQVGPYVSVTFDVFQGRELTLDPSGTEELSFDDLMIPRLAVGMGARQSHQRLFLEERVGVGGGYYLDAGFDFSDSLGGVDGDLIDASFVFTFEARLRAGIMVSDSVSFDLGVGFEMMGAPDRAQDARDFAFESTFKRKETTVITAGFSGRF